MYIIGTVEFVSRETYDPGALDLAVRDEAEEPGDVRPERKEVASLQVDVLPPPRESELVEATREDATLEDVLPSGSARRVLVDATPEDSALLLLEGLHVREESMVLAGLGGSARG